MGSRMGKHNLARGFINSSENAEAYISSKPPADEAEVGDTG